MTIRLPLRDIYEAGHIDRSQLETVDTFTQDDQNRFDKKGWDGYHPDDFVKTLLPSLGEPRYLSSRRSKVPVVSLGGKRFKVEILSDDRHEHWEAKGKVLLLEETDEPESRSDCVAPERNFRGSHYWQFFGQPTWVQSEFFPAGSNGKPCSHFVTVENGWGDSGNWNILVSLGDDGLPVEAYFEASCC